MPQDNQPGSTRPTKRAASPGTKKVLYPLFVVLFLPAILAFFLWCLDVYAGSMLADIAHKLHPVTAGIMQVLQEPGYPSADAVNADAASATAVTADTLGPRAGIPTERLEIDDLVFGLDILALAVPTLIVFGLARFFRPQKKSSLTPQKQQDLQKAKKPRNRFAIGFLICFMVGYPIYSLFFNRTFLQDLEMSRGHQLRDLPGFLYVSGRAFTQLNFMLLVDVALVIVAVFFIRQKIMKKHERTVDRPMRG